MKICAHRGASSTHPENTHAAFEEAVRLGADILEFDVRLTRDGECVIMHDALVDRTTNGKGAVADLCWEDIRSLDAGKGQQVPHLDEAMVWAAKAMLNIQIKIVKETDVPLIADALVRHFQNPVVLKQAFVTTENEGLLKQLRQRVPAIRLCSLYGRKGADYPEQAVKPAGAEIIQPRTAQVTPALVEAAHALNLKVNVYYADDEATARMLQACGVDGILTNDPGLMVKLFRN